MKFPLLPPCENEATRIATFFNDGLFRVCAGITMIIYGILRLSLGIHQPQSSTNVTHPFVAVNWDVISTKQRKQTFFIKKTFAVAFRLGKCFCDTFRHRNQSRLQTSVLLISRKAERLKISYEFRVFAVEPDNGWQGKWRWSASRWIKISFVLGDCYLEFAFVCV